MAVNRNALKTYAPKARKDFIQAMTNRAALFGITRDGNAPGETRGDLFLVNGRAFPRVVGAQRGRLIARIAETTFDQTMEAVAYTWFNRFLAIRYMELHGYFDHGFRVLSHPAGEAEPEILQQAQHLTLPGLDPDLVVDLKLAGNRDEELYRRILIAQCNALHHALPFLFERIDDETELLLPENLLQSDSIVRKLVDEIDESDWDEIEIIGWLYQFYISEKKDQVIGKVVKSEDIPAATQLFTPNWIVKYMVQNSLGAQWLATYPDSPLKASMAYYIEPAEQTPEVRAQLDAITPGTLDPETITLIDPAVGSGHILVEAYDLFRAIYLERGYTPQAAARAILTKNLFGLDIDDRAAQMAGFALLMKARADDRTLLNDPPALNVMSLVDSGGWDAGAMADALLPEGRVELLPATDLLPETLAQPTLSVSAESGEARAAIAGIVALFNGAKTFGSLITVPEAVTQSLPVLEALLARLVDGDLLRRDAQIEARERLTTLVAQAKVLGRHYNCVVANPPYMGGRGMNPQLKKFAQKTYPDSKADTFAMFCDRNLQLAETSGYISMITMQSWMFLSSYESFRENILEKSTLTSMIHLGTRAFDSIGGEVVSTTAFTIVNHCAAEYSSRFVRLVNGTTESEKRQTLESALSKHTTEECFVVKNSSFQNVPGSPLAYWISHDQLEMFKTFPSIGEYATSSNGIQTGNNDRYVRLWHEVSQQTLRARWIPYAKGGSYRKWYGNCDHVVDWNHDGRDIRSEPNCCIRGEQFYFQPGITWSDVTSGRLSARVLPDQALFDAAGPSAFFTNPELGLAGLAVLNTPISDMWSKIFNPTLHFQSGDFRKLRFPTSFANEETNERSKSLISQSREDWDDFENSSNFAKSPLINCRLSEDSIEQTLSRLLAVWSRRVEEVSRLESLNNRDLAQKYGLESEVSSAVSDGEITLTCNPHYRYGGDLTDAEREARLLSDTMRELISYGIGLVMGRYSLAEPGLIYAHAGNVGFDPDRYGAFPADDDGIIPITEDPWFADDAAARIEQFLALAWPRAPINETLAFLTDGLTQGKGGEPRAALRGYLAKTFYKDHLQTYRNRPIYWLFSSGKQKAFECLVYLHRYNESTMARMRTAYVTPLMGKMQQRIADLEAEIAASASSAEKTRKGRDRDKTVKQLAELRVFDEELRHLADQRIPLDLDDGVKVNYGRFGNLLAAKDKVCGKDNDKDD